MNVAGILAAAPWLAEARRQAWEAFTRAELPAKTSETWRRVSYAAWRLGLLTEAGLPALLGPLAGPTVPQGLDGCDGALRQEGNRPPILALDPELALKGVKLLPLEEAAHRHPELVEPHLKGMLASPDFLGLEAANLSQFRGGAFLSVPKGVRVEKPIEISFLHDAATPFCFPRVLVSAGEGSEVTVVEDHRSAGASGAAGKISSIAFSLLALGANARVRYFYGQGLSLDTVHFWHQRADMAEGARLEHYSVLLGGAVHKSELQVRLLGPGARSELYGMLLGTRNQLFDPHTAQWHLAARTESDLLFRSALKDRARSIYTGLIRVEKEAAGSQAFQQNDNLLLSSGARADSTPVLEILTHSVRCKHGATAGPVNPEELFYLCSRGLDPEEARRMLVLAFFAPILGRLRPERLSERLLDQVERRIAA